MERLIDSLELRTDLVKVILKSVPDRPGTAGGIFTKLGEQGFNVEAISQTGAAGDRCDVTFAVRDTEAPAVLEYLHGQLTALDAKGVLIDKNLALIVLFGERLATTPGVAGQVFSLLGQQGINIEVISAGLVSLAMMVPKSRAEAAVKAIRAGFGLS
jgi:aspartate kinase